MVHVKKKVITHISPQKGSSNPIIRWFILNMNPKLVDGIPTPLKNMSSSVGIIIPN